MLVTGLDQGDQSLFVYCFINTERKRKYNFFSIFKKKKNVYRHGDHDSTIAIFPNAHVFHCILPEMKGEILNCFELLVIGVGIESCMEEIPQCVLLNARNLLVTMHKT
jgi:hypothetical protein